jgi:hypothetical protein
MSPLGHLLAALKARPGLFLGLLALLVIIVPLFRIEQHLKRISDQIYYVGCGEQNNPCYVQPIEGRY